jgi:hypothetical protein
VPPKAAPTCWASRALLPAILVFCGAGCGDGGGVPLGGPFGGTAPISVLDDAGAQGDSNGVLPFTSTSSGGGVGGTQAPTWTTLFDAYFAVGKVGNCASAGCHQSSMTSPSTAFSWLQSEEQVGGSQPALTDPSSSCLTWLGGDMPPGGPDTNSGAVNDFNLWLKAGAKNN